jgi:hypothetical protein
MPLLLQNSIPNYFLMTGIFGIPWDVYILVLNSVNWHYRVIKKHWSMRLRMTSAFGVIILQRS